MNGIYLYLLLEEIRDSIIGRYVGEFYRLDRAMQIELNGTVIFVSLYPQAPAIYLTKRMPAFHKFPYFSESVQGSRIISVNQPDFMPIVKLGLEKIVGGQKNVGEIIISLYRDAPNLSIRTEPVKRNLFPRLVERKPKRPLFELTEENLGNKENIIKEFEGFDKFLVNELTPGNLPRLKNILQGEPAKPRLVSISPLRISFFAEEFIKEYASLNQLLEQGIKQFIELNREIDLKAQKGMLIKRLKKRIEQLNRNLFTEDEIEEYRIAGELILANIRKIKRGIEEIELFNPYKQKDTTVKLDPARGPQENAKAYFEKYKKLKRGRPKIQKQIDDIKKEIAELESGTATASKPSSVAAPFRVRTEKPRPFREFVLSAGSMVYVGKNAKSNEELTFKFARPDDYFFHSRGIEGAHTILKPKTESRKLKNEKQKPRKEDIERAAAIAAYFSKARKQKKVAVSYTQRKYLKKNKKGKPGSVLLMREEVIFVDPELP